MLRAAGQIPPAGATTAKPVRIRRCPATAMPFGDEPGRLRCAERTQPSEEGRFARRRCRRATSLRSIKRRFFMVTRTLAGLAVLALALVLLPAAGAGRTAFPVTIKAANGTVTLPSKPLRIVSLSPTATEDLFAIGAGPQVIAVDDQSNYPANAPKTKLSGYTPNAEAIAAYKPDLVVAS